MSLFPNSKLEGDESILYRRLASMFYNLRDKIRWDRNIKEDCIVHSIKNKRTRNTAVIKDFRKNGSGGIELTIHSRKKHSAANITNTSIIVVNKMYQTFDDIDMASRINVHLSNESEYSQTPFELVKMTKKQIADLADDECTGGYIEKMLNLTSNGEAYMELVFENNSGRLIETSDTIMRYTNNPVGNFVVFNKSYHMAFYTPERFHQYFYPVDSMRQVSKPADLFDEDKLTQPAALI